MVLASMHISCGLLCLALGRGALLAPSASWLRGAWCRRARRVVALGGLAATTQYCRCASWRAARCSGGRQARPNMLAQSSSARGRGSVVLGALVATGHASAPAAVNTWRRRSHRLPPTHTDCAGPLPPAALDVMFGRSRSDVLYLCMWSTRPLARRTQESSNISYVSGNETKYLSLDITFAQRYQAEWWSIWFQLILLVIMLGTCFVSVGQGGRQHGTTAGSSSCWCTPLVHTPDGARVRAAA